MSVTWPNSKPFCWLALLGQAATHAPQPWQSTSTTWALASPGSRRRAPNGQIWTQIPQAEHSLGLTTAMIGVAASSFLDSRRGDLDRCGVGLRQRLVDRTRRVRQAAQVGALHRKVDGTKLDVRFEKEPVPGQRHFEQAAQGCVSGFGFDPGAQHDQIGGDLDRFLAGLCDDVHPQSHR